MTRNFISPATLFCQNLRKEAICFLSALILMCINIAVFAKAKPGIPPKALTHQGRIVSTARNIMTLPPTITYSSPQTYKVSVSISPLTPTSAGVSGISYKATTNVIGSGFTHPVGVAVDGQGNVYVADDQNSSLVLKKIPAGGGPTVGLSGGFNGKKPTGVAVDGTGNVYGIDQGNIVFVDRIDNRTISTLQVPGGTDSSGPSGIAVDANRNIYVTAGIIQ